MTAQLGSTVTFTQLRYFISAATKGSVTAAADELRIAQSAVSFAIAQLERSLDAQLFIRFRGKGLVLTEAGERLLTDGQSLLAQFDEMVDNVRGHQYEVRGTAHLACFVTLSPFVLPNLIARVRRSYPRLQLTATEADGDGIQKLLRSGAVELAVSYDFGPSPDLVFDRLYSAPPSVIVSEHHPLAQRETLMLGDLAGHHLLLPDIDQRRDYILRILDSAGVKPHVEFRIRSIETIGSLVARGLGYSIVNHVPLSPRTYDGGQVRTIPLRDADPIDVCIVRPAGVHETARTTALSDLIGTILGPVERSIE